MHSHFSRLSALFHQKTSLYVTPYNRVHTSCPCLNHQHSSVRRGHVDRILVIVIVIDQQTPDVEVSPVEEVEDGEEERGEVEEEAVDRRVAVVPRGVVLVYRRLPPAHSPGAAAAAVGAGGAKVVKALAVGGGVAHGEGGLEKTLDKWKNDLTVGKCMGQPVWMSAAAISNKFRSKKGNFC